VDKATETIASRAKRLFAFAIDQTILSVIGLIVFILVFSTQTQQITNAVNAFFDDPLWTQADQLSRSELNARTEALINSDKVVSSVQALAHPFALAMGLTVVASAAYYVVPTARWGATLGKKWLRMRVHSLDGGLPDWSQSLIRYFAFVGLGAFGTVVTILDLVVNKAFMPSNVAVDALTLVLSQVTLVLTIVSIVFITSRPDRRGLHDRLARTVVHDISK
jgi:uncharacterized RDD family membrane protein YckC